MKIIKTVTMFGSAEGNPGDNNFDHAYQAAKVMAEAGLHIVNGGGPGVMLASTNGAKAGGGTVTAVLYSPKYATTFEGHVQVNKPDNQLEAANYIDRTQKLMELGDAYVVFNGGTGTISEFAMSWAVARLYFGHHKPVILYGGFWKPIIEAFVQSMKIRDQELRVLTVVESPTALIEALEAYDNLIEQDRHLYESSEKKDEESYLML